jgi:hypothetical protein
MAAAEFVEKPPSFIVSTTFFLSNNTAGIRSPHPNISFHRCQASRWMEGHDANTDTTRSTGGREREYNTNKNNT